MKLLLIEDDPAIALPLSQALVSSYVVDVVTTGEAGLTKAATSAYTAILLDLNLPDMPGLSVCQQLRQQGCVVPVIILTGETKVMSKIKLLDAGADDYLTKPFSLGELKARLRSLQRRSNNPGKPVHRLTVADLTLDGPTQRVHRAGRPIRLRRKEFSLLECLMQRAGTVVTRDTLATYAWSSNVDLWANTIDVHIKYLRDKIDRPFDTPLIKTVHGIGYKLESTRPVATKRKEVIR